VRLRAEAGSWTVGPFVAELPAVAVLELPGAVLAWTVDDPAGVEATRITFTNADVAEWLGRRSGAWGHGARRTGLGARAPDTAPTIDVAEVEPSHGALAPLRRLAIGHWLRRWWPASMRDGIVELDAALLDGELALQTIAAQDYFTDETFDSDVAALLGPHRAVFAALERDGDPRVAELATACSELADELGVEAQPSTPGVRHRDDYALAAGADSAKGIGGRLAGGVASVNWVAVPPGVFDAADKTVNWSIELDGAKAVVVVDVATAAAATGVEVRLRAGTITAAGPLDAAGRATLPLFAAGHRAVTETELWNHDWASTTIEIGAGLPDSEAAATLRRRLRSFARGRLAHPGDDSFLAERMAAESDY
jgi:hypothetical protein